MQIRSHSVPRAIVGYVRPAHTHSTPTVTTAALSTRSLHRSRNQQVLMNFSNSLQLFRGIRRTYFNRNMHPTLNPVQHTFVRRYHKPRHLKCLWNLPTRRLSSSWTTTFRFAETVLQTIWSVSRQSLARIAEAVGYSESPVSGHMLRPKRFFVALLQLRSSSSPDLGRRASLG